MASNRKAPKSKALIRANARGFASTGKTRPAEAGRRPSEPSVCRRCGAVFRNRVWRRGPVRDGVLERARWVVCPACKQTREATYLGRVRITGEGASTHEEAIRRRIENIAKRAASTQPERRVVSVDRDGDALEVLTTSQKLAHRIVHELKKVLGGKAAYRWSDDGSLFATWEPRRR